VTELTLGAGELSLVRQMSLVRVTSLLERHCERRVSAGIVSYLARCETDCFVMPSSHRPPDATRRSCLRPIRRRELSLETVWQSLNS